MITNLKSSFALPAKTVPSSEKNLPAYMGI
jgi:hypothetical protein